MLCPEVQTFCTNQRHKCQDKKGRVGDTDFRNHVKTGVARLGGVEGVTVIIPDADEDVAANITASLEEDTDFYCVDDFSPAVLFNKDFQANFVKSGSLNISNKFSTSFVEQRISLQNKILNLSIFNSNLNTHPLEEICKRKSRTKNGLAHYQLDMETLEMTPGQLSRMMEALSDISVPVSVSWTHPDPQICPSSIAKYLAESGFQVSSLSCQVSCNVQNGVTLPNFGADTCDEVGTWMGHVALGISLSNDNDSNRSSVACVKAHGLYSSKTITYLISNLWPLISKTQRTPWIGVYCFGPKSKFVFEGCQYLEKTDCRLSVIVTRNGQWRMTQAETVDYSSCKKSKYN